jgi:O-antigen/teichoic acid export membrane protein
MLLRHGLIYLFARGVPSIIGFVTIAVYTRLLSPEAYGQYALVVTGAMITNAIFYQWLSASLLRYLPQYHDNAVELLTIILRGFIYVSLLTGIFGVSIVLVWNDSIWDGLIVIGVSLVWAQAWFGINLELARSRLAPVRYGVISLVKAVVALSFGYFFIIRGYGVYGALIGLLIGFLVSAIWASLGQWGTLSKARIDRKLVKELLSYGVPITASLALTVVISSTDRFMLAGLIDETATGLYAASQGLAQQSVGVLMTMVNLAAYPLILRTFENDGADAARTQLHKNAILLLGIGLPTATGFILLAPEISKTFLGSAFQLTGSELMPWIAVATLMASVRAYYLDLAFYLGKRTRLHVVVMATAAVLNVVLNFWLIPIYGAVGAAYATVAAHGVAMVLSFVLGRSAFHLPALHDDVIRLAVSTILMAIILTLLPEREGIVMLLLSIAVGSVAYFVCVLVLNPAGIRGIAMRGLRVVKE